MKRLSSCTYIVRIFLLCIALFTSIRISAAGWTPTDGGLVVNLEDGDRILLSVMVDDDNNPATPEKEYFVYNYNRIERPDDIYKYAAGPYVKLFPQEPGSTEPSPSSVWTVGAPLNRAKDDNLGGTVYTIWNDGKTFRTGDNTENAFKFFGYLTDDYGFKNACDVVFVVPTDQESRTSFDPNKTLRNERGRDDQDPTTGKINGKLGYNAQLGLYYREVYWLEISKSNMPKSYTNAALVTFNTTKDDKTGWRNNGTVKPGKVGFAFSNHADYDKVTRTLFRLYVLNKPISSCSSYFFATDEQDYKKYRMGPGTNPTLYLTDSTAAKKIYTWDHFTCMAPVDKEHSPIYKSDYMYVPANDSTYYYVGYNNDYKAEATGETMGSAGAHSQFEKIRDLPLSTMPGFKAPAGAYGQMVVDTSSSATNLGVGFEPAGYFLKVETGKNVRMHKTGTNTWTSEEMWTITGYYASLHIKTMLMTGPEFSETDPGAAVEGWTKWVRGDSVPTSTGGKIEGLSGYAQITVNNTDSNGHMVFIKADNSKWIRYHNNGFMGLEMPKQYPLAGEDKTVAIMAPRIKPEYTVQGWTTNADGTGPLFEVGDIVDFNNPTIQNLMVGDTVLNLYCKATYEGSVQMALSFINPADSKRYFLTHPNTSAPRYARARHFDSWENTWQGMENAENRNPNYLSTFELRHPVSEVKAYGEGIAEEDKHLFTKEHVLDPRRYTAKGYVDSLTFYEFFSPNKDEYLGLYYTTPNTILANNSWAGLFTTNSDATATGWPDYQVPYIHNAIIKSERYVIEEDTVNHKDSLTLMLRSNRDKPYVKYVPATNQFDGVATAGEATPFDISAVLVADEHYIILPDTTHAWRDTITFDYHEDEPIREAVWSSLIGKQLLAVMMIGNDTIYFHPNRDKVIDDPNNLYLAPEFRVSQAFELIPDSRVTSVAEEDKTVLETTSNYWHNDIVSGASSPINVRHNGNYIDIYDTLRITLSHGGISKIKEYRGRWKEGAPGLKPAHPTDTRYRDIIIRTKTYHYDDEQTRLVLKPEKESYNFGPLVGDKRQISFILTREHYHNLRDAQDTFIREDITSIDTITTKLGMLPGSCLFAHPHSFGVVAAETVKDHVTVNIIDENTSGANYDTLIVSQFQVDGEGTITLTEPVRVPLVQAALVGTELIWSVEYDDKRYYIMAANGNLIFRRYSEKDNTLYKLNDTKTYLVKDYGTAAETQKITPWAFEYENKAAQQLKLKTAYTLNKYFGSNTCETVSLDNDATVWTYHFYNTYTNDNANYEEQVKLQCGDAKWLKFNGPESGFTFVEDSASASVFSWSYLLEEFGIYQKHAYPNLGGNSNYKVDSVTFAYNTNMSVKIQSRYKAYKQYTMLVGNKMVNLCREDEEDTKNLTNPSKEWKTSYNITRIADAREFDEGSPVSGLSYRLDSTNLISIISTSGMPTSPRNVKIGGKYVNIVDTLHVVLSLQEGAKDYRFINDWSSFKSIRDAELKIPLIRTTYHTTTYDSLVCSVDGDEYNYSFPAQLGADDSVHVFSLKTWRRQGSHVLDINNNTISVLDATALDSTSGMHLNNKNLAEVRLIDGNGNEPTWCRITGKGAHTVTVKCTANGIRSPRTAYLYLAYIVIVDGNVKFVNYRLTVSQPSLFEYANNQRLVHSQGASGDTLQADGMQQVHENKRILYYYPDQNVELPVRERAFYGWWRWYRESDDPAIGDSDIPDATWRTKPRNIGKDDKYPYPFRIIGDSVKVWDKVKGDSVKQLVTMGRYTVFHYPSRDYKDKANPPAKVGLVAPPITTFGIADNEKPTITYAVDLSNYYDHLPMSLKYKNQIDTAMLDTMLRITEPTLSLREVFELHPWTEMADTLEHYKRERTTNDAGEYPLVSEKYMEDHALMVPTGAPLLLKTEQRYIYEHLQPKYNSKGEIIDPGHSESLLGYYMRDDNWNSRGWDQARQDSMIWCGGWDADCLWYTYDPKTEKYARCYHPTTEGDDFLKVPVKNNITEGKEFDTVYYCLRARSWSSTHAGTIEDPDPEVADSGAYMFNICRYTLIYHNPNKYGPKLENNGKALLTDEEIEQDYEVLERLNFDYNKPGSSYTVYPHPLPWADASYGYCYPETPNLPHNRYHNESDFPNHGEYGLINKIPYTTYWYPMEQHGGADNGYMIYCDGMSSAGQVAALSLTTQLCEGQRLYFSGYVGNPSNQTKAGLANPNFTFSVQGSTNGAAWEDITSYMTGDIPQSNKWYQIFFPINHKNGDKEYQYFRVSITNASSDWDGNDFIIDDMCIFATKPPLIAYQANTKCVEAGQNDSITQVVLRVDYQGFVNKQYNDTSVFYTVAQHVSTMDNTVKEFIKMDDGYLHEETKPTGDPAKPDTIYGYIPMPNADYEPMNADSIFANLNALVDKFEETSHTFKQGYIYENLDGNIRPVLYVVHTAKMAPKNVYKVRMSLAYKDLMSSECAMTSNLKVSSRMVLELNGEEQADKEIYGMCANSTYDLSLRAKGSLYLDSVAPIDLNGSCVSDWLLYGDTSDVTSAVTYGYKYSDIVKVVTKILRCAPDDGSTNANQFIRSLADINHAHLRKFSEGVPLSTGVDPYALLTNLVNRGFLMLYKDKVTVTVASGDSLQYVVMPILGTGTDALHNTDVEICPSPLFIKLKPDSEQPIPLVLGGVHRNKTQSSQPLTILTDAGSANTQVSVRVDSIAEVVIHSVSLLTTDDPGFLEGVHKLNLEPDRSFSGPETYYKKGQDIVFLPAQGNTYSMKPGYNYTFKIVLQDYLGHLRVDGDATACEVGSVPFTVSIVPDQVRWNPASAENNAWNNPSNWIGINAANEPIHDDAHFAPLASTKVIIPQLEAGLPYPVLPDLTEDETYDSVKMVGFDYNKCDVIRFMPGAAIAQQQRMECTQAVIDMTMPNNRWALRAAPVTGMMSGDMFMANNDINDITSPWEVGAFDANGRSYTTGNAAYWLSLYSSSSIHVGNGDDVKNDTVAADAEWSRVTNAMTLSLPPAQGYAVYTYTKSGSSANVRLPKNDDIFYYFDREGNKNYDQYEHNLRSKRDEFAGGAGKAGQLAFNPDGASQSYTLRNGVSSDLFVFGNPTMGYIDIWGFIADNNTPVATLEEKFDYIDKDGNYIPNTTRETAAASTDSIIELKRYLPPMHAIVLHKTAAATELTLTLNTNRVVTHPIQVDRGGGGGAAPRRAINKLNKGIMTVTAINPVSSRCVSYLLLGQGYHKAIMDGEDAVLTTVNIDYYTNNSAPATPFNIYAREGNYGMSTDLRDSIINVPISFYMSNLPFDHKTQLWFTGVNNIDGQLVLYDALLDTEKPIINGICIEIDTPEQNHEVRYYIRRRGFKPGETAEPGDEPQDDPIATDIREAFDIDADQAIKVVHNGHVLVIRNGHVYTMYGQKVR